MADIRPSVPRDGDGCIAVTQPPSGVGTLAYVIRPTTPQCGTPSSNGGGLTENVVPWIVMVPSGDRVTIEEPDGMLPSVPLAADRASANASIASLSFGEFRRANPITR